MSTLCINVTLVTVETTYTRYMVWCTSYKNAICTIRRIVRGCTTDLYDRAWKWSLSRLKNSAVSVRVRNVVQEGAI
jgi:hypothetical protein